MSSLFSPSQEWLNKATEKYGDMEPSAGPVLFELKTGIQQCRFRLEFDIFSRKEVEEAKKVYQNARMERRAILTTDLAATLDSWNAVLRHGGFIVEARQPDDHCFVVRALDETGDRRIIWDTRIPNETNEARAKFEEYIKKGWRAYSIDRCGRKSHRIVGFDDTLQEVLFEEKGLRESLTTFWKKIAEVRLVPKTHPG